MLGWELPPHNSGGLGVACYHMARALALAGAKIDFFVPYTADHPDTEFMTVHSTSDAKPSFDAYDHNAHNSMRSQQQTYTSYVIEHTKDNIPDVIHAHDWLTFEAGVAAKRETGARLVAHVHATEYDRAGNRSGNPLIHEIEQEGLLVADRIIAVSHFTKKLITEKYGIPADKIEVIHNSIDEDSVKAIAHDETYRYVSSLKDSGYTVVTTIGRLTVQKGLTHFLRAAAMACHLYDRFVFVIAGDGDQRDELIRLSADLGISDKVLFTGFIRGQVWRDAYGIADVFVMSSVSEPFGLTALEAAANDTSLVITNQSGVSEVLENILRYDYWDEKTLADQLVNIATSLSLKQELARNVKHEFGRFSWADVAERCLHQYERARSLA